MIPLSIEAEFLAGTNFPESVRDANTLCKKLDIAYVNYPFNGIKISVGQRLGNLTDEELSDKLQTTFKEDGYKSIIINEKC